MKDAAASARTSAEPSGTTLLPLTSTAVHIAGIDSEPHLTLPRDHPAWQRDVLAVSSRVRAILAGLRPAAILVLSFWDHVMRSVSIGGRYIEVDPSGSYRLR